MEPIEAESGYISIIDAEEYVGGEMTGVEILRVSGINVLARGRRFGRQWLLKGLAGDLRDSSSMKRRLLKEFEIHSRLSHPCIAQVIGLEDIPELGLCIVEEWIEGKNLDELLREGRMTKAERRRTMREVISAVGYLHSKGIVHRDLKPANIMLREAGGEAIIIDFGLADTGDYVELKQSAGTVGFISPEQIAEGGARTSDDVYSLGIIMRELCPEYSSLANRCTGPAGHRPKDAGELLKIFDSRGKRARKAWTVIAAAAVAALATIAGLRIAELTRAADEAEKRANMLSKENALTAAHAAELEDSLHTVSIRMRDAEDEMHRQREYRNSIENITKRGYEMSEDLLRRYDRKISDLTPEQHALFSDMTTDLHSAFQRSLDDFCSSEAVKGLNQTDRDRIRIDINNHFLMEYSKYQDKWVNDIYPDWNKKGQ